MALQSEEDVQNELATVREYLKRARLIKSEIKVLQEDLKELNEEFKDKIDMKTLKLAVTVVNATAKVAHKHTFESIVAELENELINE